MTTIFYKAPAIRAPRPTLPPASYREILERDWAMLYDCDCSEQRETKQEHEYSAPVVFDETVLSRLCIRSPCIVQAELPLPVRKERRRGHNSSSSLSSISSTSSLDTVSSLPQLEVRRLRLSAAAYSGSDKPPMPRLTKWSTKMGTGDKGCRASGRADA
ncbi:hypothetical protein B0H21DRAFT_710580 [Amylocystis lapponica]|nr:hypothetical protein B0H21DRAFT_710580 [Amylocystis lapponica]